ncbi:hypothetical protein GYH30_035055 [Glycine max]|uniref:Acyl-[acyl-carrier-protein] desaturase n=1 Tax=Glycine max TaxID=3847 RepID=A0A0R0GQ01_SOYBN|nr:hypothetical protein GYH30_035055 [Glycine max]
MAPEKIEIFKSLEGWASQQVLPLLKPVEQIRNFFIGIFYLIENRPLAIDSKQAINHIKRKYELENMEIVNKEKEKVRYDFLVFVECNFHQHDFVPNSSLPFKEFTDEVRALRERTMELPDEYFVVLVGDMITEEALPTYQTTMNNLDGVRDEYGACQSPWAVWTRAWSVEENRHGDLLKTYMYLSGRVDMERVEKTIHYLIASGWDVGMENNPYLGFVYTSFQERATFVAHGNTARLAKEGGDPVLARICDTRTQVDPTGAMLAIGKMMQKKIIMPAHLMYDGDDPRLFEHYSAVAQRIGVYTANDYANILDFLVGRWRLEKLESLTAEGKRAQDYVCELPPRIRKLQERADERARKMKPNSFKFNWIFNKELLL